MTQNKFSSGAEASHLPLKFKAWFGTRGWQPRPHQLALLRKTAMGKSVLLIAPTGAGKTLAGFLPSLTDLDRLADRGQKNKGLHTLYISPLKALAVDIHRNLSKPIEEMGLDISVETRTGDTPSHKRQRQKYAPPDILMTTPEQLALLISYPDAERFFSDLKYVVLDELHSLVSSKRGHLLSLGLARLRHLAPAAVSIGLSATVAEPEQLQKWLVNQHGSGPTKAELEMVSGGSKPEISILQTTERLPWSGHSARYSITEVYEAIKRYRTTLIFVNTRSQAEMVFRELWHVNEDVLPIALHHGSLEAGQRRKVEKAMEANSLRAIVATSTLDLGIDWGDVDLVIHIGAPKGASRLAQRIGRSNHRMDEASRAILVPANRFEVLECQVALEANYIAAQDTAPIGVGTLDVLAQHVLGRACSGPFDEEEFFNEIRSALPYSELDRNLFTRVVQFVATGGYALKTYDRYARIRKMADGRWRISHPKEVQQYRLNIGTIVESPMLKIRLMRKSTRAEFARGGMVLGQVEEYFLDMLSPGDTFFFAGRVLRFEGIRENNAFVTLAVGKDAKVPAYAGGSFPLSTYLAADVRAMLSDPKRWKSLPDQVSEWLRLQKEKSALPGKEDLLIETYPYQNRFYMAVYPFEGRLAHQTLGMLLTRRLERAGAQPLGFVATEYSLAIWGLKDMGSMVREGLLSLDELFEEDMLGDDLEAWLSESWMMKRTFRDCAIISGLVERRHPGKEKTGRQITISTDLIYDVLRNYEPDHILLQAAWHDAATGQLDIARLSRMLARIKGHIQFQNLERISPLAVPIMMEIGREKIQGSGVEALLAEAADILFEEVMGV